MSTSLTRSRNLTEPQRQLFTINADHITFDHSLFLAENETIMIIPKFTTDKPWTFIQGTYGPFEPNVPIEVPIWLFLYLRRKKTCNLVPPAWLNATTLEVMLKDQRESQDLLEIPFYYIEMFRLCTSHAQNDIQIFDQVSVLMADIQEIRKHIIIRYLKDQLKDASTVAFTWENVSQFELIMVHHHVKSVMNIGAKWSKVKDDLEAERTDRNTESATHTESQSETGIRDLRNFRR